MPKLRSLILVVAALGAASQVHAQNRVGTLDDLREAHQLCYDATTTGTLDRAMITNSGWSPVTIVSKDGTRKESDSIFSHPVNPGWIVMPPGEDYCMARIQFSEGDPIQEYLDEFAQYRPEKQPAGQYYFCADGRTASLEQKTRTNGPMIAAYFSTQVETGRCQSS